MKKLNKMLSPLFAGMLLFLAFAVAGCGGGGGSSAGDVFVVPNIPVANDISERAALLDENDNQIGSAQFANANSIATPMIGISLSVSVDNGQETTSIIRDDGFIASLITLRAKERHYHVLPTAVDATRIYFDDSADEYLEFGYWLFNNRHIDYSDLYYRNAFLRAGGGLFFAGADDVNSGTATYKGKARGSVGNVFNAQANTFSGGVDFVNADVSFTANFDGSGNATVDGSLIHSGGQNENVNITFSPLVFSTGTGDYTGTVGSRDLSGIWIYGFFDKEVRDGTIAPTHLGGFFRSPSTSGVNGEVADIGAFGAVRE